jgi:demethylmenaquinone methyltransferase/2-methoxy-6-polyprenyl-1,4-benzoquinol methylase
MVQEVRRMFSRIAPRYDLLNRVMSLGLDLSWRRHAVEKAGFPPGGRILDLESGTGDMAREILRHDAGSRVFGVDNCPGMLAQARKKRETKRVRWIVADGGVLPFSSGEFDGASAAFVLRNLPDASGAISEIRRVLRRRGRLALVDMVRPEGEICGAVFHVHLHRIVPALDRLLGSDPDAYSYLPGSIESFYSARRLREAFSKCGFVEVYFQEIMCRTVVICIGEAR